MVTRGRGFDSSSPFARGDFTIFCCREEGRETFKLDKTWFSLETHIDQPQNGGSMNKHLSC